MILTREQVENLNRRLVELGFKTNGREGYKPHDLRENDILFYGLQNIDLAKILNDLFKYVGQSFLVVDGTLITMSILQDSYMYYSNKVKDYTKTDGISFVLKSLDTDPTLEVHFTYAPRVEREVLPYLRGSITYQSYSSAYPDIKTREHERFIQIERKGIKEFLSRVSVLLDDAAWLTKEVANIKEPPMTFIYDEEMTRERNYEYIYLKTNYIDRLKRIFESERMLKIYTGSDYVHFHVNSVKDVIALLDTVDDFKEYGTKAREGMINAFKEFSVSDFEDKLLSGYFHSIEITNEADKKAYELLLDKYSPLRNGSSTTLHLEIFEKTKEDILVKTNNEQVRKMLIRTGTNYTAEEYVRINKKLFIRVYKTVKSLGYDITGVTEKELSSYIGSENIIRHTNGQKSKVQAIPTFRIVKFRYEENTVFNAIVRSLKSYRYNAEEQVHEINLLELGPLLDIIKDRSIPGSEINYLDFSMLEETYAGYIAMEKRYKDIKIFDYTRLRTAPFKYQVEGAEFLVRERTAILGDEMGLGKTKQALIAAKSVLDSPLLSKNTNRIAVIICPNTVKLNWAKEILKVDPHDSILVMTAGQEFNASRLINNGRPIFKYIIINYDILSRYADELMDLKPACLIVDEAHRCTAIDNDGKPGSIRAQQVIDISGSVPFTWLLTGTPFRNKAIELFNLLVMINHDLALNFREFGSVYSGGKKTNKGYTYKGFTKAEELNKRLSEKMLRRRKKDIKKAMKESGDTNALLDLPDKIRNFFPVEIDKNAYNNAVNMFMEESAATSSYAKMLVLMGALKKYLAYEKIEHTYEIATAVLNERDDNEISPVVIFSDYKKPLIDLNAMFTKDGIPCCMITGAENEFQKQANIEAFEKGQYKVALCSTKAAGVGTTLVSAHNLIFNDLTWVPFDHFQAEDRIHRIGQDEDVSIYYLYCENADIDAKLAEKLEIKAEEFDAVVDGGLGETFTVSIMADVYKEFRIKHGIMEALDMTTISKDDINKFSGGISDDVIERARNISKSKKVNSNANSAPVRQSDAFAALLATQQQPEHREVIKPKPIEESVDPLEQLQTMFRADLSQLEKIYRKVNWSETKKIFEVALLDKNALIVLTYRVYIDTLYDLPISRIELLRVTKQSKQVIGFNPIQHAKIMGAGTLYDKIMSKLLVLALNQEKYLREINVLLRAFEENPEIKLVTPQIGS